MTLIPQINNNDYKTDIFASKDKICDIRILSLNDDRFKKTAIVIYSLPRVISAISRQVVRSNSIKHIPAGRTKKTDRSVAGAVHDTFPAWGFPRGKAVRYAETADAPSAIQRLPRSCL